MNLKKGANIYCRRRSERTVYKAEVMSAHDNELVLRMDAGAPDKISTGQCMVVSGEDVEYYAEVMSIEGDILRLKQMWTEKRGYFRVDDVFDIRIKKVRHDAVLKKSRIFPGYGVEAPCKDYPGEKKSPELWEMLVHINNKLDLIMERLDLACKEHMNSESRMVNVNLSASGVRFAIDEKVEIGDVIEIKMLLPSYPPIGILTYGNVVRVNDAGNGQYEIALHFLDMEDEVRNEIIKYAVKRQRDIIRKQRL